MDVLLVKSGLSVHFECQYPKERIATRKTGLFMCYQPELISYKNCFAFCSVLVSYTVFFEKVS